MTTGLDEDPGFKRLSPEEQAWTRSIFERLDKAIADKDLAAIEQIKRETAQHYQALRDAAPASAPLPAAPKPAAPAIVPIPKTPTAQTGCVAAPPKKPSFLDKLKLHAERTLVYQAAKADARIAKQSGGNVDAGTQDATATAVTQANQPKPCTPVKPAPQSSVRPPAQ